MFREELIMSVQLEDIAYHHRQFPSRWELIIGSPIFIFIIVFYSVNYQYYMIAFIAWISILIVLIVVALFYGLTVEVNRDMVRLYYGFGIIHRSILREHIAMVTQVRNRWWWGFGIRWTPHGWMWNISGLDAVELTYHNGKKFRIGTDEPEALLEALKVV